MLSLFSIYLLERNFLRCYHKSIGNVEKKKMAKLIRLAEVNNDSSNSGNINKSHHYSQLREKRETLSKFFSSLAHFKILRSCRITKNI